MAGFCRFTQLSVVRKGTGEVGLCGAAVREMSLTGPGPRKQRGLLSRATAGDCLESSYFKEKPLRESSLLALPGVFMCRVGVKAGGWWGPGR